MCKTRNFSQRVHQIRLAIFEKMEMFGVAVRAIWHPEHCEIPTAPVPGGEEYPIARGAGGEGSQHGGGGRGVLPLLRAPAGRRVS